MSEPMLSPEAIRPMWRSLRDAVLPEPTMDDLEVEARFEDVLFEVRRYAHYGGGTHWRCDDCGCLMTSRYHMLKCR
jgi:hypothetical protein